MLARQRAPDHTHLDWVSMFPRLEMSTPRPACARNRMPQDPTVALVRKFVTSHGGSFGMAKLRCLSLWFSGLANRPCYR